MDSRVDRIPDREINKGEEGKIIEKHKEDMETIFEKRISVHKMKDISVWNGGRF